MLCDIYGRKLSNIVAVSDAHIQTFMHKNTEKMLIIVLTSPHLHTLMKANSQEKLNLQTVNDSWRIELRQHNSL